LLPKISLCNAPEEKIGEVIKNVALLDTGYISKKTESILSLKLAKNVRIVARLARGCSATTKDRLKFQVAIKNEKLKAVKIIAVINETVYGNFCEIFLGNASINTTK